MDTMDTNDIKLEKQIVAAVLGLAIGDALGVPAEFLNRQILREHPVTDMSGYGTHQQPPGTWSDDTSMTLCLLTSLCEGVDYENIMHRFASWTGHSYYTAGGTVFDIGVSTRQAILSYVGGTPPLSCGGSEEYENGNGSLMRILPLVFYLRFRYGTKFYRNRGAMALIHNVSALTHAHPRSQAGCGIYLCVAGALMESEHQSPADAIHAGIIRAMNYYETMDPFRQELAEYRRLLSADFASLPEDKIQSSGYVVHTLEAALWCLLNADSYRSCVLKAVNLGDDTDTVAAVAGGLAGIYYGLSNIPQAWLSALARKDYIVECCRMFADSLKKWPNELNPSIAYHVKCTGCRYEDTFYTGTGFRGRDALDNLISSVNREENTGSTEQGRIESVRVLFRCPNCGKLEAHIILRSFPPNPALPVGCQCSDCETTMDEIRGTDIEKQTCSLCGKHLMIADTFEWHIR